ncbi:MAG: D-alanyl-D-alanine carboxypeptidase/D-alanyl-D-alanine-endopeptidase [Candidatus Eisenbacteria bacterium]|nr:D-alanyl-D-alanine carboxypeptidase/D-alanyl-D-alanine-endopeptidase [Candidatus Eisenbacteria bacterium]
MPSGRASLSDARGIKGSAALLRRAEDLISGPSRGRGRRTAQGPRIALLFAIALIAARSSAGTPAALADALRAANEDETIAVGVVFAPVCGAGERVAIGGELMLPPASVQKVVTSAAALDMLGPGHRFSTSLLREQEARGGILEGDLYLVGDGDPFLVSERLWLLGREAAISGLTEVRGDIVVAAPIVADLDSLRLAEASDSPYAAPVSILGVNFNSVSFLILPGASVGERAECRIEPFPLPGIESNSLVETVLEKATAPVVARRSFDGEREVWTLEGAIAHGSGPARIFRSTRNPGFLAGGMLRGILAQQGIGVSGVRLGAPPAGAYPLATLESLPLSLLVRSMNLWSNNFMADLLLVDLGADRSAAAGRARVEEWLRGRVGLDPLPILKDGCGLSPSNRISAEQIVRLLAWAHGEERIFPDLYASFARPGDEGTMEKRFRDGGAPGLRAKTGTLGDIGVSSMAGYVDRAGGERYAFCILQQGKPGAGAIAALRAREEAWLRLFVAP